MQSRLLERTLFRGVLKTCVLFWSDKTIPDRAGVTWQWGFLSHDFNQAYPWGQSLLNEQRSFSSKPFIQNFPKIISKKTGGRGQGSTGIMDRDLVHPKRFSMKFLLFALLLVHGLIHTIGVTKAWNPGQIRQATLLLSRPGGSVVGALWLFFASSSGLESIS